MTARPPRPHHQPTPRRARRQVIAVAATLALLAPAGALARQPAGEAHAAHPFQAEAPSPAVFLPLAYGGGSTYRGSIPYAGLAIVADPGSRLDGGRNVLILRPPSGAEGGGFTAYTDDAGGVELMWERLEAPRVKLGMHLELASEDAAGTVLGRGWVTPGELGLDIHADPDGTGTASHYLELRLAGRVVARLDGHVGVAARTDKWPSGFGRIEARPGGLPAVRFRWTDPVGINIPGGPATDADELIVRSETAHAPAVMDRFTVRIKELPRIALFRPVLRLPLEGCAEAAPIAPDGSVVFPVERDPAATPVFVDVADDFEGYAGALYGAEHDTTMDTWYDAWPCDVAIGGALPSIPPLDAELGALGLTSGADAIAAELARLDAAIGASTLPPALEPATVVDGAFTAPTTPFQPEANAPYGGRDIIFVHDLATDPLAAAAAGDATAIAGWARDAGDSDLRTANASFYAPGGYWKAAADAAWATHIGRLAGYSSRRNRYLTVAWPATQRLDIGAHAMLAQIADAMVGGTGVVVPVGGNAVGFCQRPDCVIVSHGAGALLTDIALDLAAKSAYPGTAYAGIPPRIKAHVALHGAFGGTELAAVVVGQALGLGQLPDGCVLAGLAYRALDTDAVRPAPACAALAALSETALRDLVPSVATARLAAIGADARVPALLVAGAHATYSTALKHALLPGFDDGVVTLDGQCASPNAALDRPSRYDRAGDAARAFDLGLTPQRAAGYLREQAPANTAAGCTPYTSPAGMLQPVADRRANSGVDALARTPGHHTFLVTASDHVVGPRAGRIDRDYRASEPSGERSWEEVRVITDPAVYAPDARFPVVDPAPLIGRAPAVGVHVRGRKVVFDVLRFGRTYQRTWWLWQRSYVLPEGSEALDAVDYVYRYVLRP